MQLHCSVHRDLMFVVLLCIKVVTKGEVFIFHLDIGLLSVVPIFVSVPLIGDIHLSKLSTYQNWLYHIIFKSISVELLNHSEDLNSPVFFFSLVLCFVFIFLFFMFFLFLFCFCFCFLIVCFCLFNLFLPVSCVPNVVSVSGLSIWISLPFMSQYNSIIQLYCLKTTYLQSLILMMSYLYQSYLLQLLLRHTMFLGVIRSKCDKLWYPSPFLHSL